MFKFGACAAHTALQALQAAPGHRPGPVPGTHSPQALSVSGLSLAIATGYGGGLRLVWTAHPSEFKFME